MSVTLDSVRAKHVEAVLPNGEEARVHLLAYLCMGSAYQDYLDGYGHKSVALAVGRAKAYWKNRELPKYVVRGSLAPHSDEAAWVYEWDGDDDDDDDVEPFCYDHGEPGRLVGWLFSVKRGRRTVYYVSGEKHSAAVGHYDLTSKFHTFYARASAEFATMEQARAWLDANRRPGETGKVSVYAPSADGSKHERRPGFVRLGADDQQPQQEQEAV